MKTVQELVSRISKIGYAIVVRDGQPSLKRQANRQPQPFPDDLKAELIERRQEILDWFSSADTGKAKAPEPAQQIPGQTQTVPLTKCPTCQAEVNPAFLADSVTQKVCCGVATGKKEGLCPYVPKPLKK